MWAPLMQSADIHDFLVYNPWMPSKNGKNKTISNFRAGFRLGSFPNIPMPVQNGFQLPQPLEEDIKAPLRDKTSTSPLVQDYAANI
jgi:hypothetical protein